MEEESRHSQFRDERDPNLRNTFPRCHHLPWDEIQAGPVQSYRCNEKGDERQAAHRKGVRFVVYILYCIIREKSHTPYTDYFKVQIGNVLEIYGHVNYFSVN